MKLMMRRIMYGLIVAQIAIFTLSYHVVRSTTFRKAVSPEKQAKIEADRAYLMALPGAQKVTLATDDGLSLSGLLVVREHAKRVVLLCHGYRMCKEYMKHFMNLFPEDTLLAFDFRAHGESEGSLISIGHFEQIDVRAAVNFLKNHEATKDLPLIGLGVSMGGATLLGAASKNSDFHALIIDSSFANLKEQVARSFVRYTGLPRNIFMPSVLTLFEYLAGITVHAVKPVAFIENITSPVLIVHSEDDDLAPVANAHKLYAAANVAKDLWLVKGAEHAKVVNAYPEEYFRQVHQFLNRYK